MPRLDDRAAQAEEIEKFAAFAHRFRPRRYRLRRLCEPLNARKALAIVMATPSTQWKGGMFLRERNSSSRLSRMRLRCRMSEWPEAGGRNLCKTLLTPTQRQPPAPFLPMKLIFLLARNVINFFLKICRLSSSSAAPKARGSWPTQPGVDTEIWRRQKGLQGCELKLLWFIDFISSKQMATHPRLLLEAIFGERRMTNKTKCDIGFLTVDISIFLCVSPLTVSGRQQIPVG